MQDYAVYGEYGSSSAFNNQVWAAVENTVQMDHSCPAEAPATVLSVLAPWCSLPGVGLLRSRLHPHSTSYLHTCDA